MRISRFHVILFIAFTIFLLTKSCKKMNSNSYDGFKIYVDFKRIENSMDFYSIIKIENEVSEISPDQINVKSSKGNVGEIEKLKKNTFRIRVFTSSTGEYEINVSIPSKNISTSKTALVFSYVSEEWNQPEKVEGYVNTSGWEDGVSVSNDCKWLFIQYLPVSIDCMISGDPSSEYCKKALGPVKAPYRPDMPGAERVSEEGYISHECPSLNFFSPPFPVPPNSIYGFKRNEKDEYINPFPIFFDGADGCISAFGPQLVNYLGNTGNFLFSFDNPLDEKKETYGDIYIKKIKLGEKSPIGTFKNKNGTITLENFNAYLIKTPEPYHQGNPYLFINNKELTLFYDDEEFRKKLFYIKGKGEFPDIVWGNSHPLPYPLNSDSQLEAQPLFYDKKLFFRREIEILSSEWLGGDLSKKNSWSKPKTILKGSGFSATTGEILGAGEPSICTRSGKKILFFVYILKTDSGIHDLNIGFLKER